MLWLYRHPNQHNRHLEPVWLDSQSESEISLSSVQIWIELNSESLELEKAAYLPHPL